MTYCPLRSEWPAAARAFASQVSAVRGLPSTLAPAEDATFTPSTHSYAVAVGSKAGSKSLLGREYSERPPRSPGPV